MEYEQQEQQLFKDNKHNKGFNSMNTRVQKSSIQIPEHTIIKRNLTDVL